MLNKHRILIFLFMFLGVMTIGFLISSRQKQQPATPPRTELFPNIKDIPFPTISQEKQTIVYNQTFTATQITTNSVPAVRIENPLTLEDVQSAALAMKFPKTPTTTATTYGFLYRWKQGDVMLTYSTRDGFTYVNALKSPFTSPPDETGAIAIAQKFLKQFDVSGSQQYMLPTGVVYSKLSASTGIAYFTRTTRDNAMVAQVNFSYNVNGIPLYIPGRNQQEHAWVKINGNGILVEASVPVIPQITVLPQEIALRDMPGDATVLNTQGVLVDHELADDTTDLIYLPSPPSSISTMKTYLGYYYESGYAMLSPAYFYEGTGVVDGKKVRTTTMISAVGTQE